MTVQEAIEYADEVKPNAFSDKVKVKWLAGLEGRILSSVFLLPMVETQRLLPETAHMDWELMVHPPHDDIYPLWLNAKIDEANGEYNKYANSMAIYNAHYNDFVRWFCNLYEPARGYPKIRVKRVFGRCE